MSFKICSLFSGSSGNCTYVETKRSRILIDAGVSRIKIANGLKDIGVSVKDIDAVIITHEHNDHISGAGVLARKDNIPIYANESTWDAIGDKIGEIKEINQRLFYNDMDFYIKDINIQPYEIPHDAASPVGFCLYNRTKKISITTDLGHTNKSILSTIMDSDLVLLESNHDVDMLKAGPYPWSIKKRIMGNKGHLSNEDAAQTIIDIASKSRLHVLLAHLSQKNNFPQLAYETVSGILKEQGIKAGVDITLEMTYKDRPTSMFAIV